MMHSCPTCGWPCGCDELQGEGQCYHACGEWKANPDVLSQRDWNGTACFLYRGGLMSWAARNPELYAEIERSAVLGKLTREMKANGFDEFDVDTLENIMWTLQEESPNDRNAFWSHMVMWAQKELSDAESDAFADGKIR